MELRRGGAHQRSRGSRTACTSAPQPDPHAVGSASVVGAIIGELPSGIADGLGRIILNFNQYYATGPERLWAGILFASLTGMAFFMIITVLEKIFVRHQSADAV